MEIDYIFDGEDERKVATCPNCQWPSPAPMTTDEWRAHQHIGEPGGPLDYLPELD
jgi:hypothetical protein